MKGLIEKRNRLVEEMHGIVNKAEGETRALETQEVERFEQIKGEISSIDATLKAADQARAMETRVLETGKNKDELRALDEKHFLEYCRGETRALDAGNNGGIIPTTIADRIIETVKELSPIYRMVTTYSVKGTLVLPVYDETASSISAAYSEEFNELTEGTGKFTTVTLNDYIIGCLAKISKSLMNRTDFDLLNFVVRRVAQAIVDFLEKECIIGTANKMTGITSAPVRATAAASSAITADECIDLQDSIPDVFQQNACWIMHKTTRRALRKLKNGDGEYLLQKDLTVAFGYTLLGKPIYTSESMPQMAAGNKVIVYGDMTGLCLKVSREMQLQTLLEKYATQYAVGVVSYIEADSKISEPQKLAVLAMKGADA